MAIIGSHLITITVVTASQIFLGNGATTSFNYAFIAQSAASMQVLYTDTNGNQSVLLPTAYTLTINPPLPGALWGIGGTVVYPTSGPAIANGTALTVRRIIPFTQTTTISNQGDFSPKVIETALDTLCMEIQQVAARTGQWRGIWATGIQYNFGDTVVDGINGTNTENYYVCIVANTSGVWATDLANGYWTLQIDIQGINTAVADAQAAALAAAASASAANISAGTAATQAGIATTQAGIATTQAGNAATSANTAGIQAGIATTQAGIATTQAGNAATSAGTATTQAGIATTQAGIATTQAGNASNSANAAAASALLAASTFIATSTTSNTIGTGTKNFTTQANKNFQTGQYLLIVDSGNNSNYMFGQVLTYNNSTGALSFDSQVTNGSGTHAGWNISISGIRGSSTGDVSAAANLANNAVVVGDGGVKGVKSSTLTATVVKSTAGVQSAATAGTDYSAGTSALATGLLKSTTTSGALSIAAQGTDYYAPGGTDVAVADGGTNISSYAVGDILVASGTTTLVKLADIATGNALITGGVGVAPSYGKIGLTTHVSGNLPVGNLNSGTNASATTYWRGDGTWVAPGGGQMQKTIFTNSGTFTTSSGSSTSTVYKITVTGGGGGGGAPPGGATPAGGGGAGGTCIGYISGLTPSTGYGVTVGPAGLSAGAGGSSNFNAVLTAGGGQAGSLAGPGGVPGNCTGGDININGGYGDSGYSATGGTSFGAGGASFWGGGGASVNGVAAAGQAYGSGGSGFTTTGGVGKAGIVTIEWIG